MMTLPNAPRVLFIVDSLYAGGQERQLVELLKGLHRSGRYTTALVILNPGGQLDAQAREWAHVVLPVQRRAYADVTFPWAVARAAREAKAGLVQSLGWMSDGVGLLVASRLTIPWVNASFRGAPPSLSVASPR
jgi:hypothetical protein